VTRTLVAALAIAAGTALAAQAECRGDVVDLHVARNGTVSWNNEVLRTPQQMTERFRREARSALQPKIHFLPEPEVDPAVGLSILTQAQSAGFECIAFSGFGAKRSN
jgi:hypothetical protein